MHPNYLGFWLTALRALLFPCLVVLAFSGMPEPAPENPTPTQFLASLAILAVGVKIGFLLFAQKHICVAFRKLQAYHYFLATGLGFTFFALWASEGGSNWLFVLWFLPAGILEAIVSKILEGKRAS